MSYTGIREYLQNTICTKIPYPAGVEIRWNRASRWQARRGRRQSVPASKNVLLEEMNGHYGQNDNRFTGEVLCRAA